MQQRPDPKGRTIPDDELRTVATLIRSQRWASLATLDEGNLPLGSMVAYTASENLCCFDIHLSQLSRHTRNLMQRPHAALTIAEQDTGSGDPQTLARLCLQGRAQVVERDSEGYTKARARYLSRLPDADRVFGFSDFVMFCFTPQSVHYVGGFARAYRFAAEKLVAASALD